MQYHYQYQYLDEHGLENVWSACRVKRGPHCQHDDDLVCVRCQVSGGKHITKTNETQILTHLEYVQEPTIRYDVMTIGNHDTTTNNDVYYD